MDRQTALIITLGLALGLLAASQVAEATIDPYGGASPPNADPLPDMPTFDTEQKIAAFLALIRRYESGDRYNVIFGGQSFDSYAAHPGVRVPFRNPATGKPDISTAAGAYQFILPTWNALASRLGLADFSPASQDAAARQLLIDTGAAQALANDDITTALRKASTQWASLPYSAARQNAKPLDTTLALYDQLLQSTVA